MEATKAAPTGCYKCGRPGHWSRDCPDSNPSLNPPLPNSKSNDHTNLNSSRSTPFKPHSANPKAAGEKPKKLPRTRPKLTAEILLGDDGLGYVLRHFPRNFKYRGRGHEVIDLGNLIRLYTQWHSRLLPYYSFDQFVHKVEQVAATKRVKTCLKDLRERVASGVDPTKLHESATEHVDSILVEGNSAPGEAALNDEGGPSTRSNDEDAIQQEMFHGIFDTATHDLSQTLYNGMEKPTENNIASVLNEVATTDEQRAARMEAGRLKALERAAVPSLSNEIPITNEQRARIEANRLKALERAAARSSALR